MMETVQTSVEMAGVCNARGQSSVWRLG